MLDYQEVQRKIIFLGPHLKLGKGGISSLLKEYNAIFPKAVFIATTISKGNIQKLVCFIYSIFRFLYILFSNPNIKIIHIHGSSYSSFYRKYFYYKVSKILRKKTIYHIHSGSFDNFYKNSNSLVKILIKDVVDNVDCLICLSSIWREFFIQNFNPRRIEIVPNIISQKNTRGPKIRFNDSQKIIFLFLGLIHENKGIWLLLDVINSLKHRIKDDAIFLIGGNGNINMLNELIVKYNIQQIVKFVGWVENEKKDKLFRESDVFILPSFIEGLPITILEAMTYNLAIISTSVGSIPELVHNGKNGILIEPRNKNELEDAILYAVHNKSKILQFGKRNTDLIKRFSPEIVTAKLLLIYNDLMGTSL